MPPRRARLAQSTLGAVAAFVFVPAHERHAVASTRIGERNAGVARGADGGRNTRDDLEWHAVLVKEQGFLPAAIEQERVSPLQPRDDLSFPRFLDEQVVDGFLIERLRRGQANVDLLSFMTRIAEQPRVHEVVVQHHIGGGEVARAACADETRVSGPGADEVDDGSHSRQSQRFGIRGLGLVLSCLVKNVRRSLPQQLLGDFAAQSRRIRPRANLLIADDRARRRVMPQPRAARGPLSATGRAMPPIGIWQPPPRAAHERAFCVQCVPKRPRR